MLETEKLRHLRPALVQPFSLIQRMQKGKAMTETSMHPCLPIGSL
jgi:hypothetical protein